MEYRLEIAEETQSVEATPGADGLVALTMGEQTRQARLTRLGQGELFMVIDGKCHKAFYAPTEDGGWVHVAGRVYQIKDVDKAPARRKASAADGPGEVTPPMPAVVVRVNCAPGDKVTKGQGLVVVSAMKMETTLAAPYAGTVTAVNCAVDGKVMPGDILVDIAPDPEEAPSE